MNITIITISSITVAFFLIRYFVRSSRRKEIKDWQINDVLFMDSISENKKVAVLLGWNFKSAIVRYERIPNQIFEIDISDIKNNKSAYWRRLKTSCKDTMGVEPNFNAKIDLDTKKEKGNPITGGKPIELLTEIECQIYLKECLKNEDYETAELIRKQMEKYR